MADNALKRAKEVFHAALEKQGSEREEYVATACGADNDLRERVRGLLRAHEEAGGFLASPTKHDADEGSPATDTTAGAPPEWQAGTMIGPYRLLQVIGEGGFGVVYMADQEEPIHRRVALKIIKLGMDTRQVIARFEAERQALALMDHPNIARVLDVGATDAGRPYFAMELVEGVPLTDYCDENCLGMRARLELFSSVCRAVQHAHQKGVIHRDIKPSNVLVALHDGRPVPKVIDFGIAKATHQRLTEKTLFTQEGQFIGTPVYMSPEQAEMGGLDVDTRTDIYSLGVLLYELLTGATPFDTEALRRAGFGEIQRIIREEEPPRPSARVSTLGEASTISARARQTDPRTLRRDLAGDLDWITMRALEKDRARRYTSASELEAEVERYLASQPVLAGPPSASYRARKFIRRHRFGVITATLGIAALIIFAAFMTVQSRRVTAERDRAEQAQAELQSVVDFQAGMLSGVDPEAMGRRLLKDLSGREAEARRARGATDSEIAGAASLFEGVNATDAALRVIDEEILARALETLEVKFADEPLTAARLRQRIGVTYGVLGMYDRSERALEDAVSTYQQVLGADQPETLAAMYNLANLYRHQGRYQQAESLLLETLEREKRVLGPEDENVLVSMHQLSDLYEAQHRFADGERITGELLEKARRVLGPEHRLTLACLKQLADLYGRQGKYAAAEELYLEALDSYRRLFGPDQEATLSLINNLAIVYEHQGRDTDAERLHLETLEARKRTLGSDHPKTLSSMHNLASVYDKQGRYAEAERLYVTTIEGKRRMLGAEHPSTLSAMNKLALVYRKTGRYTEAEALTLETLDGQKRVLGANHRETLGTMSNLALIYSEQGRIGDAVQISLDTLDAMRSVLGPDDPWTLNCMSNLGELYVDQGRYELGESLLLEALKARERVLDEHHPETLDTLYQLAVSAAKRGDRQVALEWLGRAVDAGAAWADFLEQEPDMEALHGPEFDRLVERSRQNEEED